MAPATKRILGRLLADCAGSLSSAGIPSPRLEAELLAAHVLSLSRLSVIAYPEREVTQEQADAIVHGCRRRAQGEPLAYITGIREFYGRDFHVRPGVLVPRPETELVVDTALDYLDARFSRRDAAPAFADLGTGTGCLGISLALEDKRLHGILMDRDPAAIDAARENARALGAANIRIIRGDIFSLPLAAGSFDLVVSNPPYIGTAEQGTVEENVDRWEPAGALYSDEDGLTHIRHIIRMAPTLLRDGGILILEHGFKQAESIEKLLAEAGFGKTFSKKDLSGLDRVSGGVYIHPCR